LLGKSPENLGERKSLKKRAMPGLKKEGAMAKKKSIAFIRKSSLERKGLTEE